MSMSVRPGGWVADGLCSSPQNQHIPSQHLVCEYLPRNTPFLWISSNKSHVLKKNYWGDVDSQNDIGFRYVRFYNTLPIYCIVCHHPKSSLLLSPCLLFLSAFSESKYTTASFHKENCIEISTHMYFSFPLNCVPRYVFVECSQGCSHVLTKEMALKWWWSQNTCSVSFMPAQQEPPQTRARFPASVPTSYAFQGIFLQLPVPQFPPWDCELTLKPVVCLGWETHDVTPGTGVLNWKAL